MNTAGRKVNYKRVSRAVKCLRVVDTTLVSSVIGEDINITKLH